MRKISTFGGWQRLWMLASALLFLAALVFAVVRWPTANYQVIEGIDSPQCAEIRGLPEGSFQRNVPMYGNVCDSLSIVIHSSGSKISSRADYTSYLSSERLELGGRILVVWSLVVLGLYLLGSAAGWVIAGFRRPRA